MANFLTPVTLIIGIGLAIFLVFSSASAVDSDAKSQEQSTAIALLLGGLNWLYRLWYLVVPLISVVAYIFWKKTHLLGPELKSMPYPHMDKKEADVIIIGCGVVGSALATALGKQGRQVLVFERDLKEPNRIVGELMQPGGVEQVRKLGLSDCFEGIDSPVTNGYVVFQGEKSVLLNYTPIHTWDEKNQSPSEQKQVPHGRSFHHGKFIMNLRAAAKSTPNVTLVEATVTSLIEGEKSVVGVTIKEREEVRNVYAPLVIVCDGVHSKFRREIVSAQPMASSSFCGLVLEDAQLPFPDRGHVILAHPSPILAYPISSHHVRVLVDVPHPMPSASNGDLARYLREKTAPQLPALLQEPFIAALDREQVKSMPCARLHPEVYRRAGLIMIGDAWNMRHPLTGGGMTVGLSDAVVVRDILAEFKDFTDQGVVCNRFTKEFYSRRIGVACSINVLAQALYGVFASYTDKAMPFVREACFNYFKLGGECVAGPMGLLAGTCTNNWVLIVHFFSVAFYGMIQNLFPIPWPSHILRVAGILISATKLITPLLISEHFLSLEYPL